MGGTTSPATEQEPPLPGPLLHKFVEEREKRRGARYRIGGVSARRGTRGASPRLECGGLPPLYAERKLSRLKVGASFPHSK